MSYMRDDKSDSMAARERELRALAARAGYPSLRALAVASGCDRTTIAMLARGGRETRESTVDRVAATLGVPAGVLSALLGGRS